MILKDRTGVMAFWVSQERGAVGGARVRDVILEKRNDDGPNGELGCRNLAWLLWYMADGSVRSVDRPVAGLSDTLSRIQPIEYAIHLSRTAETAWATVKLYEGRHNPNIQVRKDDRVLMNARWYAGRYVLIGGPSGFVEFGAWEPMMRAVEWVIQCRDVEPTAEEAWDERDSQSGCPGGQS